MSEQQHVASRRHDPATAGGPQTHHHAHGRALPGDAVVLEQVDGQLVYSGPKRLVGMDPARSSSTTVIDSFFVDSDPDDREGARMPQPVLPADREVASAGELVIFDDADVRSVLEAYKAAAIVGNPMEAMRAAMMLTLQVAAINLEIR